MVVTLVLILAIVVFVACFVGFNLDNVCKTFWFFKNYNDVPVTILVFTAFGAGIVLSLLCVLFAKLRNGSEEAAEEKKAKVQEKLKKAEEKAKIMEEKAKNLAEKKNKKAKPEDANKTQEMNASDLQQV